MNSFWIDRNVLPVCILVILSASACALGAETTLMQKPCQNALTLQDAADAPSLWLGEKDAPVCIELPANGAPGLLHIEGLTPGIVFGTLTFLDPDFNTLAVEPLALSESQVTVLAVPRAAASLLLQSLHGAGAECALAVPAQQPLHPARVPHSPTTEDAPSGVSLDASATAGKNDFDSPCERRPGDAVVATVDDYEPDNIPAQANSLNAHFAGQVHNFHTPGDVDWVRFDVPERTNPQQPVVLTLRTELLAENVQTRITLFAPDAQTELATDDGASFLDRCATIVHAFALAGPHYLRVEQIAPSVGAGTEYNLCLIDERAPAIGQSRISGVVLNALTQCPLPNVDVALRGSNFVAITADNGEFEFAQLKPGSYTLEIDAIGFERDRENIDLRSQNAAAKIELRYPCDAPPQPQGLQVTVQGNTVSLSWNPAAGATGYSLYRSTQNDSCGATHIATVSNLQYQDSLPQHGGGGGCNCDQGQVLQWRYWVAAENDCGEGPTGAPAIASVEVALEKSASAGDLAVTALLILLLLAPLHHRRPRNGA